MPRGRPGKSADDVFMKSAELLGWALGGLEREIVETRERLHALTEQADSLRRRLGTDARSAAKAAVRAVRPAPASSDEAAAEGGRARRRRKMSAEARQRLSEMMKQRWAERRKQEG